MTSQDLYIRGSHHVTPTISQHGMELKFSCTAEPGAPCFMACPQGCDDWCSHPKEDTGHCNFVEWMEAEGTAEAIEAFDGTWTQVLTQGEIIIAWRGQSWGWTYAGGLPEFPCLEIIFRDPVDMQMYGVSATMAILREAASWSQEDRHRILEHATLVMITKLETKIWGPPQ
jgi:hypothetical protein